MFLLIFFFCKRVIPALRSHLRRRLHYVLFYVYPPQLQWYHRYRIAISHIFSYYTQKSFVVFQMCCVLEPVLHSTFQYYYLTTVSRGCYDYTYINIILILLQNTIFHLVTAAQIFRMIIYSNTNLDF